MPLAEFLEKGLDVCGTVRPKSKLNDISKLAELLQFFFRVLYGAVRAIATTLGRSIAEIESRCRKPPFFVPDLNRKIDLTDVRDYRLRLFSRPADARPGEAYNLASGRAYSTAEIVDILLGFASCRIEIEVEVTNALPPRISILLVVGDFSKEDLRVVSENPC